MLWMKMRRFGLEPWFCLVLVVKHCQSYCTVLLFSFLIHKMRGNVDNPWLLSGLNVESRASAPKIMVIIYHCINSVTRELHNIQILFNYFEGSDMSGNNHLANSYPVRPLESLLLAMQFLVEPVHPLKAIQCQLTEHI